MNDFYFINRQTKESLYEGYLNRSESLDWEGFETRAKTTSTKRDDAASAMLDVDGTTSQLQTASAGPAPRITIRYNDPGSLESVKFHSTFSHECRCKKKTILFSF